jgi:hypothetical protein
MRIAYVIRPETDFADHQRSRSLYTDGIAFSGEGKLVRKATGYEQEKAEAALSHIGFAGCASRASARHSSISVTHTSSDEASD